MLNQFDAKQSIEYLKDGYVLCTIFNNRKTYVSLNKSNIKVFNDVLSLVLSENEFIDFFKDFSFSLVEDDEVSIDPYKDEAYYRWKQ